MKIFDKKYNNFIYESLKLCFASWSISDCTFCDKLCNIIIVLFFEILKYQCFHKIISVLFNKKHYIQIYIYIDIKIL